MTGLSRRTYRFQVNASSNTVLVSINAADYVPASLAQGPGIGVSATSGAITVSNTGVLSISITSPITANASTGNVDLGIDSTLYVASVASTTNQVLPTSASHGAVVLSLANPLTTPGGVTVTGSLTLDGALIESYAAITAGTFGTNCTSGSTCTTVTATFNVVTGSGCVALPVGVAGLEVRISNQASTVLAVCPALGGDIDNAGTNVLVTIDASASGNGVASVYQAKTATQWYTIVPQFYSSASVLVTPGPGGYTFTTTSSSEVTSWQGTANQLNPTTATTGPITASLSSALALPGTLSLSEATITSVGSTQTGGTAVVVGATYTFINTNCAAAHGVTLPVVTSAIVGLYVTK